MSRYLCFIILMTFNAMSTVLALSLQERQLEWDYALLTYYKDNGTSKNGYPFRVFMTLYYLQKEAYYALDDQECDPYIFDDLNLKVCNLYLPEFSFPVAEEKKGLPQKLLEALIKKAIAFKKAREENPDYQFRVRDYTYFPVPAPPSQEDTVFWGRQIERLVCIRKRLTFEEGQLCESWKNLAGPGRNFINLLMNYLECHMPSTCTFFDSRASLIGGMFDAFAISGYYKNEYNVPRPYQKHPVFEPLFAGPDSPSYPSGHASIAGVSSTLLNYYYPEARSYWTQLSSELACSRLWAGVHYPIDIQEGRLLGERVGRAYITGEHLSENPFALTNDTALLELGK
jgi:hypothetical protein